MSRKRNDSLNKSIAIFSVVDGMNANQIFVLLSREANALVGDEPISYKTIQRRVKWFMANKDELAAYFSDKLSAREMMGVKNRFHL